MLYHSTRSLACQATSAQAVLEGLAPDGGLYMPQALPDFDWRSCLTGSTLDMATAILTALLPDIPNMPQLVHRAYAGKFETEDLTPTVPAGPFQVLELFRGPTSAFKDVALSMLPQLLTAARDALGVQEEIRILTATSGDTGKAALEGFHDVPGVGICVFYPDGGVSQVQRAQMVTQEGSNVHVCAVRGNFDDAQTGDTRPMVVLSTASPYKFPAAVLSALGLDATGDGFDQMDRLQAATGIPIPKNLASLRGKPELHTAVIDKEQMLPYVLSLD